MILPPLFDCNAWIGEPDDPPVGGRYDRPPGGGPDSPEEILATMDDVGIDRALVYHMSAREGDIMAGNELLMDIVADYPRFEPCWVVSPAAAEAYGGPADFTAEMIDADVGAVRMFPGEHDYRLTDDAVDPLLSALEQQDAVLLLDALAASMNDGFEFEDVEEICRWHQHESPVDPQLDVIVTQLTNYSMGSPSSLDGLIEHVNAVPNFHVDTARFGIHDGAKLFVDEVGPEHLLFGTHQPHAEPGAAIWTIMQSRLTREERQQVGAENLSNLLGDTAADWEAAGRAPVRSLKTVPYEIIDIHGHVRDEAPPGEPASDADGIVEQMDRAGIALCAVSQTRGGPAGNTSAARAAEKYPDRLVPYAVANPNWDDPYGELERCFDELGMQMIKIHPASHDTPAGDESYDPIYQFANEREALVVTHARMFEEEKEDFIEAAQDHPDMTLMLYHAGRAWDRAPAFIEAAEKCPNVLLEITFSYCVQGIIEHLIDHVGAERVFFGTDLGARAPENQVGWAVYADLDPEAQRKHLRENALRLLDEQDALPASYQDQL